MELATDFSLLSSSGENVSLSDYKGKKVVLYFYPKDMTPGCTTQACEFRDRHDEFGGLNTFIIGVSTDPMAKHDKFIQKYGLPFVLLSDEDHKVCELYGVWVLKKNYGKEYMGIERTTFLIDEEGFIEKVWKKVKVKNHIEDVLNYIKGS
ncbi:MAG: Thiol peroxidaseBcp-type [Bacillales bacterium]|jgi:peroxiredoxin Q/BCP|nr:Thiol peroxidaseBcp-type [Bacillales bacterium]